MRDRIAIGWMVVIAAVVLTVIRVAYRVAGMSEPGVVLASVHAGLWELLMVGFMVAGLVVVLRAYRSDSRTNHTAVEAQLVNPPIINFVLGDKRSAPLWTVIRLYVGFAWLDAGYLKLRNQAWMADGVALKHFWVAATGSSPTGDNPALAYDWYHAFLTFMLDNGWYTWLAKIIAIGEIAVGILLLLGALVGIAGLFGIVLNFNYALAGSFGTNTVLLMLQGLLISAWMVAGYVGADRYLLPRLGTPWQRRQRSRQKRARPTGARHV